MNDFTFETLTPDNAVLLLVDHQVGTMNFGLSDIDALHLKNQTLWSAESAKAFGMPVILTTSNPDGANGPLFPELLATLGRFAAPLGKLYSDRLPNFGFIAAHLQHQAKLSHA